MGCAEAFGVFVLAFELVFFGDAALGFVVFGFFKVFFFLAISGLCNQDAEKTATKLSECPCIAQDNDIMKVKMIEKPWFKWLVIGSCFCVTTLVAGVFLLKQNMQQEKLREFQEAQRQMIEDYELQFRSTTVRIYKNLQLKHFLAAYRLLEDLDAPPLNLKNQTEEYRELVFRIAEGLMADRFFDEAQTTFEMLLNIPEYDEKVRHALSEIASSYRLISARRLLDQSEQLVKEEKWHDAKNELRKARLEFQSVKLFGTHNIDEELKRVAELERLAFHQVHLIMANLEVEDARRLLNADHFMDVQTAMSRASQHVGRAAFYNSESPEVARLREELISLEAELAYRVPNILPIWNKFKESEMQFEDDYFYLRSQNISTDDSALKKLQIGLKFSMQLQNKPYYILRYKIYYSNGMNFFNGQYLTPELLNKTESSDDKSLHEVIYEQEIPERFWGKSVKRIELKVYDPDNQMVSFVTRAFRQPN